MVNPVKDNIFQRAPKTQRRVVVTGMGAVTPLGLTVSESWKNAISGVSGIDRITQFDPSGFETQIAGEVKNFDPHLFVEKKEQKKMDRFIQLALGAAEMAVQNSGLDFQSEQLGLRTGVIVSAGLGGLPGIERMQDVLRERGPGRISPFFIPMVIANLASGHISIKYGAKGVNYSVTSACATGAHSIGEAAQYIRNGTYDVMIAGGAESTVSPLAIGGFNAMKALSTRNDQPKQASRPWDRDRDGFVLGEGAGVLILEDYEHASRRGAHIYAEVAGYGVSSDAYHMTTPSPGGEGAARAMQMALRDAELNPGDIGYVNAHGTSTPAGDELEASAIKTVLADAASQVWVSSTKSMTGHTLGAAGAIESIFSILALQEGVIPPTLNLENPSDGCDLDFVPFTARERKLNAVLNNSFGFGGTNACLAFTRI